MTDTIRFTVWATAATKGAVRPIPIRKGGVLVGSRLTEDSKRSRPWQALVRDAAREAVGSDVIPFPLETAVRVRAVFWLPAPQSLPKRRPSAPIGQRAGDADKLARGVLDSLIGVVVGDDGQVVELHVIKAYVAPGTMPHVDLAIEGVDLNVLPWCKSQARVALPQGDRLTAGALFS